VANPISSATLAAFVWVINSTVVTTVPKCGRNSQCFFRSAGAEEGLEPWGLKVSRGSLADEPKHVFGVSVILLQNQVICAG